MNRLAHLILFGTAATFAGCTQQVTRVEPVFQDVARQDVRPAQPPGVVEYVWEEPMVDVVDVPPGLDTEGHYYRPGHEAVVEIRQGRWKYYRAE